MHSKINNCCKILFLCLVLVSCGKSKEDEKLFEELNASLENSNRVIRKQTEGCLKKLEAEYNKASTKSKSSIWLLKAKSVEKLSDELITYLDLLQQQLRDGKHVETTEIKKLYFNLMSYKQKVLLIDNRIASELGIVINTTNIKKDSTEITPTAFNTSFNTSNSLVKLAIFKNRIEMIKEMIIEYCSKQYCNLNIIYDEFFRAIAYQNSIHFKPKEILQITAGVGAFTNDVNGKVKINGEEIKLNDEGVAEFRETVPSKKGVYHKNILLQFTKPDGTISSVEKKIIYTVDE